MSEGLGYQSPEAGACEELRRGEVGFLFANVKTVSDAQVGDTITDATEEAAGASGRFSPAKPMVFGGPLPGGVHAHGLLRDALEKLD